MTSTIICSHLQRSFKRWCCAVAEPRCYAGM